MKENLNFPSGFLWGAATSAHQVEGNNFNNDWWLAEQEGRVDFKSGLACNHYELFEKDFDLASSLNQNAHRFSIEWSRVEPKDGFWDENEILHYRNVLLALKKRNLKSFVTLHHFTNPIWFMELGGWENSKAPEYFARFVSMVSERLGDLIDFYVTINEPLVYLSMGYENGTWPPFKKKHHLKTLKVFNNLVKAHKLAYLNIKKFNKQTQVGLAANLIDFQPRHKLSPVDWLISKAANYFWNEVFLNKVITQLDFIGVNYYFHSHIHTFPFIGKSKSGHDFSDLGWGIHPEGLYFVVKNLKKYNRPIYITENGIADAKDEKRVFFTVGHLRFLHQTIQEAIFRFYSAPFNRKSVGVLI